MPQHLNQLLFVLASGVLATGIALAVLLFSHFLFATAWSSAMLGAAFVGGAGSAWSTVTTSPWRWVAFLVALVGFGGCLAAYMPLLPA